MSWPKTTIQTAEGIVEAMSPSVISASRSTDIPAFYADWFFNRLKVGHLAWTNPFNRKISYIDLNEVAAVVFWTKNPKPMLKYIPELERSGFDYYFQYTLNNYENENLEPRVPPLSSRLNTFKELSRLLGKERVIWRFDPICLSDSITTSSILEKISTLATELQGFTEKLVFSFVDILAYKKVQNSLTRNHIDIREPLFEERQILAEGITRICRVTGLQAATCGEEHSFEELNIEHNKCVDDDLLERICSPNNHKLKQFLGLPDQMSLIPPAAEKKSRGVRLKDKGQRGTCGCICSKDIGMYNTCSHLCVYCYANTSEKIALKNRAAHNPNSDRII